jgi:uncharacterized protein YgiB involved in biofilm formation
MKRSTRVSLVLLASVSAAATLSGCEQAPPAPADNGGTFANKAECVAVYDQATCDAADRLARTEHVNNAPRYASIEACRQEYGPDMCQPISAYGGSGNFFVPMMMGYMMGSALSTPAPLYYGPGSYRYRDRRDYQAPIYTSGAGYARNAPIGAAPYRSTAGTGVSTKGALKSSTAMTPPSSVRGGFGSSFKPTQSFKSSYQATNPSSFGNSSYSRSTGSTAGKSYSSGSSYKASSSISSRGGFGASGRSFGGGFGG